MDTTAITPHWTAAITCSPSVLLDAPRGCGAVLRASGVQAHAQAASADAGRARGVPRAHRSAAASGGITQQAPAPVERAGKARANSRR